MNVLIIGMIILIFGIIVMINKEKHTEISGKIPVQFIRNGR